MKHLSHDILLRVVKALNVLLITAPFAFCWYFYYADLSQMTLWFRSRMFIILVFSVLYFMFGKIYEAFQISLHKVSEMVYSQALAFLISDGIMYIIICFLAKGWTSLVPGLTAIALQFLLSYLWSKTSHIWYFSTFPPKRSAVVYGKNENIVNLINEYQMGSKYDVVKTLQAEYCLANLSELEDVEVVFLSRLKSHDRNSILKYCVANNINVFLVPSIGDTLMNGAQTVHLFHLPMKRVGRYMATPEYLMVKDIMDRLIAIIGLVITSPILLIAAIAIKSYDHGPVFYKQTRLTKNGREFEIIKFRSMKVNAESDGVARLSTGSADDRVTPVGKVIRKYRIDELPQLLNVLKGDISFVGPRPERPEIHKQYVKELPEFDLRLQAKAGLTGYAQVYGKYNTTPYDKLQMDLMYIATPSILEDIKIIFATIKIIFIPESTEGVQAGQVTALSDTEKEAA